MIEVVWPARVLDELDKIEAYIAQFDSGAAVRLRSRLVQLGESLRYAPHRGRPASNGARELVTVQPYVLRYRVVNDQVVIVRVRHSARKPPR